MGKSWVIAFSMTETSSTIEISECIQLIFVQYTPNMPIFKPGLNSMPISKSNKYNAWMEMLQCDWFSMHQFRLQPLQPWLLLNSYGTFVRNDDFGRVVKDRTLKDRLTTERLKDRCNDRTDDNFLKGLSISGL